MPENPSQPRKYDAVLGSQVSVPSRAAVLGGLEAVKLRLASSCRVYQAKTAIITPVINSLSTHFIYGSIKNS
ncbi:MAG TPA: hypothetical protein DCE56_29105 [Cyanobacteria bacterium UBA8553]|nr:hypothetical protein [Cyanobacteria bacterium UBA8553]HAJ62734.1 hypothetical protein [Cyanobacteria bacterium UBA8543]